MRKLFITFLLFLISFALVATEVFFSPADNLVEKVVTQMNKAQHSIDLSIYTFNSKVIRTTLLKKLQAGIKVRIVINKGNSERVKEFVTPLIEQGANIRFVSKINHHKFFIVDSDLLYNSSGNMSDSPRQASYNENSFVCSTECKRMVKNYRAEFQFLFHHAKSYDGHPIDSVYNKPLATNALFTTTNFTPVLKGEKVVFKKDRKNSSGKVATALVQAIDKAKTSIQVATGHFRSYPLYKALSRAAQRGVKVEVLLDSQEYVSTYLNRKEQTKVKKCMANGKSEEFCSRSGVHFSRQAAKAGILVKIKYYALRWFFPKAPQMHSKYMIIDGKSLYTGSYNWSYNAEFNTFENIAIFHNQQIIKKYQQNFRQLYNLGPQFSTYMQQLAEQEQLPLFFKAISLSIKEIDQLVRFYRTSCSDLYRNPQGTPFCQVTN